MNLRPEYPLLTKDLVIFCSNNEIYTDPNNKIRLPETGSELSSCSFEQILWSLFVNSDNFRENTVTVNHDQITLALDNALKYGRIAKITITYQDPRDARDFNNFLLQHK